MPHDPAKIVLCREWLTIAMSDLRAASILMKAFPPEIPQALYPAGSEIEVSSEEAEDAYRSASDTMRVVLARLPPEVFP
jgi:hypothetical protein